MNSLELINKYHSYPDTALKKIEPKWADGTNTSKISDPSLHPTFGNYTIYYVSLTDLISKAELFDFDINILFTGNEDSDYRICTTLAQWENGGVVDPPIVSPSKVGADSVHINDGRHRTKAAFHLKAESIPIAFHNSFQSEMERILSLK